MVNISAKPLLATENYTELADGLFNMFKKASAQSRQIESSQNQDLEKIDRLIKAIQHTLVNYILKEQVIITDKLIFKYLESNSPSQSINLFRQKGEVEIDMTAEFKEVAVPKFKDLKYRCKVRDHAEMAVFDYTFIVTRSEIINELLLKVRSLALANDNLTALEIVKSANAFLEQINELGIGRRELTIKDLIEYLSDGDFDDFINSVNSAEKQKNSNELKEAGFSEAYFNFKISSQVSINID